jgi:hypothetical protein
MATSIGIGAYQNAINMISYPIGPNITSIGEYAFYNCYNLQTITIPASVGTIGANAFARCSKLTSVYFLGNAIPENSQFASPFPTIYVTSAATGWASSFSGCNITRVPAVVGAELPGGIKVLNPSPTDAWSGPYSSVGEANLSINPLVRYKTMIVTIASDLYWYRNGILDTDLVLFNGGKYNSTVPNLTLLPTKGGFINTNIESGLAYTVGSSIAVTGTGTYPSIYYVNVTSNTSIAFNQAATVDVFMIGGGGGGGGGSGGNTVASAGGGGGAGGYMSVGSIPVASETNLVITVGAGGAGGTTAGAASNGGSTFIQSGGSVYQSLTVTGGGRGGVGGGNVGAGAGSSGGCGGGAGGGYFGGAGSGSFGYSGGGSDGSCGGGGGGGSGGAGVAGTASTTTGGGGGGITASLTILNGPLTFGGGGGGGGGNNGRNAGSSGSGSGYGGGGGSASVGGGTGTGGTGGTGRVILKVKTPVNINPFTTAVSSYLDTTNSAPVYKFEGLVSSYDRTTGAITISNIQNITGSFAGSTAYTFNVNTLNGANAGTNIEIIDSKVNLSINSDIQMNDKAIVSPSNFYLEVPVSKTVGAYSKKDFAVNVNGSPYNISLHNP